LRSRRVFPPLRHIGRQIINYIKYNYYYQYNIIYVRFMYVISYLVSITQVLKDTQFGVWNNLLLNLLYYSFYNSRIAGLEK
jgi:hypothetical protein